VAFVVVANILADVVTVAIEIAFNIIVIVLLKRYNDRKNRLTANQQAQPEEAKKSNKKTKAERNSIMIVVIMSLLSTVLHLLAFMVKFN
jgi:hypothetical protein